MAAQLSAEEAAVYDRQIRLWGVDAQARMQSSRVVLAGRVDGALAEIAKNLVLAGVKLTLSDDTPVQEADLCTNFFLRAADVGRPTAEACAPRMRELNPLSAVDVLDTPLASADDAALASALASATVLVLGGPPSSSKDRLSDAARAAGVAVVQVHVCGPFSLAWLDWGASYTFSQESKAADPTAAAVKQGFSVSYPSCTEARALRPAAGRKVRRAADKFAVLCCMWALEVEALRGSSPGEADLSVAAAALATACGLPSDTASPAVAAEVVRCRGTQDPSACALVGGLLAVEVTKVLQRKGMPAFHLVVFDGRSGESRAVDLTSPLARYDPPFVKDAGSSTADQAPSGAEPDGGAEVLDDDDVVLEG